MSGQETLRACPFGCESRPLLNGYDTAWWYSCPTCGCEQTAVDPTPEAAAERWNTRASGWQDELVEALRRIAEDFDNSDGVYEMRCVQRIARDALAKVPTPPQADGGETE